MPAPTARILAELSRALIVRLLREGFVLRALVWPGALCAATIAGTVVIYLVWGLTPPIVVSDQQLARAMEAADFNVTVDENPLAALERGVAIRGAWREGDTYILGEYFGGPSTLRAEGVLRDLARSPWRIEVPEVKGRDADVDPQTRVMAALIGVLFTLYGTVMGAGTLFRDRSSGALEGDLSLPTPFWVHGAARLIAVALVVGPSLAASLGVVHAVLPLDAPLRWIYHGTLAGLTGGAIGLAVMAASPRDRGFSAPLTRALAICLGLLSLGWALPTLGSLIPVASLAALTRNAEMPVAVAVGALATSAAAVARMLREDLV
jgi:hypothetical protein